MIGDDYCEGDGDSETQEGDIPFRPILSFAITSIILELRGLYVSFISSIYTSPLSRRCW